MFCSVYKLVPLYEIIIIDWLLFTNHVLQINADFTCAAEFPTDEKIVIQKCFIYFLFQICLEITNII